MIALGRTDCGWAGQMKKISMDVDPIVLWAR